MITLITGAVGLALGIGILWLVRRDQIEVGTAVFWAIFAIGCCGLGVAPAAFDRLATLLGIVYSPSLAFTLALAMITLKLVSIDIQHSKLYVRQKRLAQRLAIMEAEIRKIGSAESADSSTATRG